MFKISIVDTGSQRRLVLEGRLVRPWTAELEAAWKGATEELQGRRLVVDVSNVTLISPEGESTLFNLMRDGAKFSCVGVHTRHLLRRLARRCRCRP